ELRMLAALFVAWVVLYAVPQALAGRDAARAAVETVLLAALLALFYHLVKHGSAVARILFTILAAVQIVSLFLALIASIRVPLTVAVVLLAIAVRAAAITLINIDPIPSIRKAQFRNG